MAAVMDVGGSLAMYNISASGAEADERALASDWAVIGSHIQSAAESVEEKA